MQEKNIVLIMFGHMMVKFWKVNNEAKVYCD